MGHLVQHADTGEAAVAMAGGSIFDVIFMDISLPGIDGIEAARQIRALHGGSYRSTPIIAMSAHVFQNEITEVLEADMDAFIGKPISPERLAQILNGQVYQHADSGHSHPAQDDTSSGNDILEASVLRDDLSNIGVVKVERMVSSFMETSLLKYSEIQQAIGNRNLPGVAYAAHYIKGSAMSLGLLALASRAQNLEADAKAEDAQSVRSDFEGFDILLRESRSTLQAFWKETAGNPEADHLSSISTANM